MDFKKRFTMLTGGRRCIIGRACRRERRTHLIVVCFPAGDAVRQVLS